MLGLLDILEGMNTLLMFHSKSEETNSRIIYIIHKDVLDMSSALHIFNPT